MDTTEITAWRGHTLVDAKDDKIGTIEEIYLDEQNGRPEWALVNTGLFGSKSSFVPLAGATADGDNLRAAVEKERVKDAPRIDPEGRLSQQEEAELFRHYGVADGDDTSGPTTDQAMTRSEEELRVGTAERESGRVRLRKYVVTEQVQQTVPVRREEVRVEREPISGENVDAALDGPEISDEEHEIVLHEEQPVVQKQAVPKERIRLGKDTVSDEQTVTDEVRKEQIEIDGDSREED